MRLKNHYFLLRHGQTVYQTEKSDVLYPNPENPPVELTDEGKRQIESAAKELKNNGINLIFSSPFFRTQQTAEIVAKELGLEINFDARLRDLNIGKFHGGPKEDYKNFFLEKRERFFKRPPGGENWRDVIKRLISFLNEVETKYQGNNILIISHGDPLWLLAGTLKGIKKEEEFLDIRKSSFYPGVGQLTKI